eukprot:IDg14686t1
MYVVTEVSEQGVQSSEVQCQINEMMFHDTGEPLGMKTDVRPMKWQGMT